jgi:tRNA G18 (ribose-2'-O)-methylase SpoU
VASPIAIAAPGDSRLGDYAGLTDVHLRRSLESAHGLFIAEGEIAIRRAVSAGYRMRSLLVTTDKLAGLADLADLAGLGQVSQTPVYVVSAEVAQAITGYRVHRGALASMHRRPIPQLAEVLARARHIVVLEDLVDHENVGAIFRCAAGLGFDAAVLAPRCADPLYRRAVKVSTGAVFALPYTRMPDWRGGLAELRAADFQLVALTPAADAVPIAQAGGAGKLALMLGTEGGGLSRRWLDAADQRVRIPMAAGIDSLNVASAAAIACYLLGPAGG